jgi:hypothetical protein
MTPPTLATLGSLLPAAGAVALVARTLAQRPSRPARTGPVQMPVERPARPARRVRPEPAPHPCDTCGTEITGRETTCAGCARAALGASGPGARTTLLHWLVFLAMMTAILGAGYALAP